MTAVAGEEAEEGESLAEALAAWGLTGSQVAETLEATDFGLGLVELKPPGGGPSAGIAIVVDDRRDRELRELFDWREGRTDQAYCAEAWDVEEAPSVRVVLGPDGQALVRLAITIREPAQLERRFLFAVNAVAPVLAKLQVPGMRIWLVPSTVIERETARQGPRDTYEVVEHCLPAGLVARAVASIDEALAHVGAPRQSAASRPMNRAERRASQRRKRG